MEIESRPADPEAATVAVRDRFLADFPAQYDTFLHGLDRLKATAPAGDIDSLRRRAHRLVGLAGMVGLPTVSARARELEEVLERPSPTPSDLNTARDILTRLSLAFDDDVQRLPRPSSATEAPAPQRAQILIVEDDADQRTILAALVRQAGYEPLEVERGDTSLSAVRSSRPALVLLDVDLPGASGIEVCRAIKADKELHETPVIFLTARIAAVERVAGLTVGADDYILKPADPEELRLRIARTLRRQPAPQATRQGVTPHEEGPSAAATPKTVVIAEDDPDVMRILDTRLRAAGFQTLLAFDGQHALEAIATSAPDLVVLDLMLPRRTGFEVLTELQRSPAARPKVVVISARGREEDVTRAFGLGADDYLTKPFGPEELVARIRRLLR